jgi:hypothetical protein
LTTIGRRYIIPNEVWRERTEALGDSAVAKLTTRIKDIKRSSFLIVFWSSFPGLPQWAANNRKTRRMKGGGSIGIEYKE